ncbi:hypothetical protein V5O48_017566, partial [Marasmius crinis-equi]
MSGYEVTGSPWDLDAVLSAMNSITTVAPEPALHPCEPKIFDHNENEVTFRGEQTTERYYEVSIDSNPSQKFQSRQGLYRASDDMDHKKHSAKGLRTGPYELFRAKEVYQHHCLQLHKRLGDPTHHQLREDAAQQALRIADSARARLLQQELRLLFPGMLNDGEPLPSLEGNPNLLKSGVMREDRLGGEFHKFPLNAEFRSSESLGSWALFVVSGDGIEKYSSLQPATVAARRKVAAGPVAIVFTPWAVNAQKVFGMLTGKFSREQEDAAIAGEDDVFFPPALDSNPRTMPQDEGPSSTTLNSTSKPVGPAPETNPALSPEPPVQAPAAADKPPPPSTTASAAQNPPQNAGSSAGPSNTKAKTKKRRRRNPGNFTDSQRDFFESHYDEFAAHPRKDKSKFWDSFFPSYFELFPLEEFPPPPVAKPLAEISEADRAALGNEELKARKRNEKRRELDETGRMKDSIKNWFQQRQQKGSKSVEPFLNRMATLQKDPPPRKRQLRQFLVTHPDYKDKVMARSTETSARDRLEKRLEAAVRIIAEMPGEEKAKVVEQRDELHKKARAVWVEKNKAKGLLQSDEERKSARELLPAFIQPLLEVVRDLTGYSVFFQAGIDTGSSDLKNRFESVSMCSTHEGAPEFVDFNIHAFQRFGTDFNGWLQTVKTHAPGLPNDEDGSQEPASTLQQESASLGAATSVAQQKGSQNESKKTRRGKATRKRKRKSDAELEDEEEDSPDLGDDSDELDELNFDQLDGEEDGEGEGEGQREAEPGKRRGVPYSAYELQRLENMERNQQLLAQLGLQSTSSFIRGSKPSTTPESDDVEGTEMRAEPEKPAERPRPKPQRVLRSSVQKNNGSAGPSPIVDPLTSTSATVPAVETPLPSQPPTSRSQPQPSPCPSPAQLPSTPQPPSGSQPSSPRPSASPTQ